MDIVILQDRSLFKHLSNVLEETFLTCRLLEKVEDIEKQAIDFLILPNDADLLASIDLVYYQRIIIMSEQMTLEEMRMFFHLGVRDCVLLPTSLSAYMKELSNRHKQEKRQAQKRALKKNYLDQALKESLAYDLLHGNTKNAREIWERSKLANLSAIPNVVFLLSIDHFLTHVENKGEYWKNSIREEVLQAIRAYFHIEEPLIVLVNQQQFAVLVALPVELEREKYKTKTIELAESLREEVNETTAYSITIGIGNVYEDARNLHLSFQESEYAQSYRLYSQENAVIHYANIDYYETTVYEGFKTDVQEVLDLFLKADMEMIAENWRTSFREAVTQKLEPGTFRLQVVDLLFTISKAAIQHGANPKQIMPMQMKYAKQFYELETMKELEDTMLLVMEQYLAHMHENKSESSLKLVQDVLSYMEKHYAEDISLDMMAEKVAVSPNYLSHLFKQTTGSSFVDYLTGIRIKTAKEMLADLHVTIHQIANEVGYSSSQYFSRVFKKHTDMTPTTYRNNLLKTKKVLK